MASDKNQYTTVPNKQGGDKYPGIDSYEKTVLKRGSVICALVAYHDNGEMKKCEYFFPKQAITQEGINARKLSESLQIAPWEDPRSGKYLYKNRIAYFVVIQDIEVQYSANTSENTCFGEGGIPQYHIPAEIARKYLKKEGDDTLLTDEEIDEEEYELMMEKREQILIKRNLFGYLKTKAETLDILQNAKEATIAEEARRNLETINQHIEYLMMDLAFSQEQIGDILSDKYDKMITLLLNEMEIREEKETLLVSNIKIGKELDEISQTITERVNMNLITPVSSNLINDMGKDLTTKIEESERKAKLGEKPDIDVKKQRLCDILNIKEFNKEGISSIKRNGLREIDFSSITQLVMQNPDGQRKVYQLTDFLTEDSIAKLKQSKNGEMTPALKHKESGAILKFMMHGNKPQLYIGQNKESLSLMLTRLHISPTQVETLKNGGEITLHDNKYRIDMELNTLVPSPPTEQKISKKNSHRHRMS